MARGDAMLDPIKATVRPRRPSQTLIPDRQPARRSAPAFRALVVQLRPRHWVKNLTCLAGLVFSGQLFQLHAQARAIIGFLTFCLVSSSVYILNDYLGRKLDRLNPRTSGRPLASGSLPLWLAGATYAALLLAAGGLALCLGSACFAILITYAVMNVFYSVRVKEIVIADVICIALGFVLRVMLGVYAVGVRPTPWIVLCMFFLSLFLGFAKRKSELVNLGIDSGRARPVLLKYGANFLDTLLTMSSTMAILCYATFTVASHKNPTLVVTIVPVVYCIYYYMLQVIVHNKGESPDQLLLSDRHLRLGIACWIIIYICISYFDIRIFADNS
jgi:4-hydroxybenzoate polyprenyltransferase